MPPRRCAWLIATVVACCACSSVARPLAPAPTATPVTIRPVSLPRDTGAHTNLTEWWYVTGHLRSQVDQHEYGFEFTIFQIYYLHGPAGHWLGHFAVTDVHGRTFSHQAHLARGSPRPGVDLDVQGWTFTGDGSGDLIRATMAPGPGADPPCSVALGLTDLKPPALHHGGYIDFGPAGGSYYYSRTRLAASGELGCGAERPEPVAGQAWMDHQWGDFVVVPWAGGWDWFGLQLDDATELMLFVLRDAAGDTATVLGTRVRADGEAIELPPDAARIEATGRWTSPHTGGMYPSGWRIHLAEPDTTLLVRPQLEDQELYFPGVAGPARAIPYWEGAVAVRAEDGDEPAGVGYVELTGYAR